MRESGPKPKDFKEPGYDKGEEHLTDPQKLDDVDDDEADGEDDNNDDDEEELEVEAPDVADVNDPKKKKAFKEKAEDEDSDEEDEAEDENEEEDSEEEEEEDKEGDQESDRDQIDECIHRLPRKGLKVNVESYFREDLMKVMVEPKKNAASQQQKKGLLSWIWGSN